MLPMLLLTILLATSGALAVPAPSGDADEAADGSFWLQILHTNDMHSR